MTYRGRAVDLVDNEAVGSLIGPQHRLHLRCRVDASLEHLSATVVTMVTKGKDVLKKSTVCVVD